MISDFREVVPSRALAEASFVARVPTREISVERRFQRGSLSVTF